MLFADTHFPRRTQNLTKKIRSSYFGFTQIIYQKYLSKIFIKTDNIEFIRHISKVIKIINCN